ncbi:hypothetical protein BOSE62_71506 [Bosea sp. 62]|uniref:hypothetical protein n=1 Tax=unclassified Bosea (in: a-proteobacteria) TaxID=2653178 RepID=UPI0012562B0D|nr:MULTISPECIES: hypothetical protein [unclassified Bosea (in: a-proteobacteria)]CAD5293432.1 hypothetical protein BOSE21B_90109 [Bosea sp. 21B]CAD5293985.1 hypothetical protein BOSE46_80218 [Bosea sp. 46]CAD5299294.1 hypothetical protein BOSE7B_60555 [Bosea sp. 7B]VVT62159.1 hypothetical protein BOS5A_30020 [Bosea sp. EC-HK365B]VXB10919.1 hypothetical protein BOSE125_120095 [Bosea sp. 125]
MKLVIISDIHGNFDALRALPERFDELWGLGRNRRMAWRPMPGLDIGGPELVHSEAPAAPTLHINP